jgi:protein-tyrosine phosphatase
VQEDFLQAAWRCIDEEFGGLDNYRRGPMGLDSAGVQRLQQKLLGDQVAILGRVG